MAASGYLVVRNFDRFQHYKDRNPPWIKFYTNAFDDYEFGCLQDASKLLLIGVWVLASRTGNRVPNDPEWIAKALYLERQPDIQPLVDAGFISVASDVLSSRQQNAIPETETEGEGETEGETETTQPPGDTKSVVGGEYLATCVAALNRGLGDNPHLAGSFNRLEVGRMRSATGEPCVSWEADGIDLAVAEEVVYNLARSYRPVDRSRQPQSLRYFDRPVRQAAESPQSDAALRARLAQLDAAERMTA